MCGIGGIMIYPMERNPVQMELIRQIAAGLALENEVRGNHATGIATFDKYGKNSVLKNNIPASQMVHTQTWGNFVEKKITRDTTNILVHTRLATQGSPEKNDNNHPIVTSSAIGVHNGMIYNDDSLFQSNNLYRQAEVDSEVIFRLIDTLKDNTKASMKTVAEKLTGVFAVAYVKKDEPTILNYFRDNNPTTFAYIEELNIIVFASQKQFIMDSIQYATDWVVDFLEEVVYIEEPEYFSPPRNSIFQFDVAENNPIEQLYLQEAMEFTECHDYGYSYYGYKNDWMDDEDQWAQYYNSGGSKRDSEILDVHMFAEESIRPLLSEDQYDQFLDLLKKHENNEWSKGYQQGRDSTEIDIKIKEEVAYEKGASERLPFAN